MNAPQSFQFFVELVSVSSRSYILSYAKKPTFTCENEKVSFRLLSELYSLLLELMETSYSEIGTSFRLLSELYSLL